MTQINDEHKYVIDMNKHRERMRIKDRLKRAEDKLDKILQVCQTNKKVDWDWAELTPKDEFQAIIEIINE